MAVWKYIPTEKANKPTKANKTNKTKKNKKTKTKKTKNLGDQSPGNLFFLVFGFLFF